MCIYIRIETDRERGITFDGLCQYRVTLRKNVNAFSDCGLKNLPQAFPMFCQAAPNTPGKEIDRVIVASVSIQNSVWVAMAGFAFESVRCRLFMHANLPCPLYVLFFASSVRNSSILYFHLFAISILYFLLPPDVTFPR
jgi:hypothetical protein